MAIIGLNIFYMFYYRLPLIIGTAVGLNVFPVLIDIRFVFAAFQKPALFIFSALGQRRSMAAGTGFIMLYKIDVALFTFLIPAAIGGECLLLRTGIRILV